MSDQEVDGPATNLLKSLVQLGGSLLLATQTRVELFTAEVDEDLSRAIHILWWGVAALLTGIFGMLLAGVTVIIVFWESHRIGAALGVTGLFLASALAAWLVVRKRLNEKPRFLDATRSEIRKDVATLRSRR